MNLAYLLPNACSTYVWQLLSSPKKDWLNSICHIFLLLFLPQESNFSLLLTILFFSLNLGTVTDTEVVLCPTRPAVWSQSGDFSAYVPKLDLA